MNCLIITPYYAPYVIGGAEISTQLIAEGLTEKGHKISVLTIRKDDKKSNNGVKFINADFGNNSLIWEWGYNCKKLSIVDKIKFNIHTNFTHKKLVKEYINIFKINNFQVIVLNSNIDALGRASIWKAANILNIPIVLTLRDPILYEKKLLGIDISKLYRKLIIKQLRYVHNIVAPSRYMLDFYKDVGIFKKSNKVIYNAVDIKYNKKNSMKQDVILYAGSIRKEKGIITLVKSFEMINQKNKCILKLYGKGELAEKYSNVKNVVINNWIERGELYNQMNLAKIVILPSEYPEAFGRILIEAVYNGTLAIGSCIGGIPEIFENDNRYLFRSGDANDLQEKIKRILDLSEEQYIVELQELRNKFKRFDKDNYIQNWENWLELTIKGEQ